FLFSSRRRHTRFSRDWSSDVCSSDLAGELSTLLRQYRSSSARDIPIVALLLHIYNIHDNGVEAYQGVSYVAPWFWNMDDKARTRSEERRVGKEGRSRWGTSHRTQDGM